MDCSADKVERVLDIYSRLMNGTIINKFEEATDFNVNERSIQRDIDSIRNFLKQSFVNTGVERSIIYDRVNRGYRLEEIYETKFSNSEILAICKIMLDSRAFTKKEMDTMLNKMIENVCRKLIKKLLKN